MGKDGLCFAEEIPFNQCIFMAITEKNLLSRLWPLVDLNVHHVAVKQFHYHATASLPYNLLIFVIEAEDGATDAFACQESGQRLRLEQGHFYLLPRQLSVRFDRTPQVTGITMRFDLSFFYGMDVFDGDRMIHDCHEPALVGRIRELVCQDSTDLLRTVGFLKATVMEACLACWPKARQKLNPALWKYESVFRYVREHCDARLSVADLAGLSGSRQDVFSRAFSRDIGVSVKSYLVAELLKKIAVRLLTTEQSLREIAEELHFSSEYYLSRFFKKGTGVPPREYRQAFGRATVSKLQVSEQ